MKPAQKKIILHFDTSKTIVLSDQAIKINKEQGLLEILAGYVWGRVE